jgi:ankyrin repeat protein
MICSDFFENYVKLFCSKKHSINKENVDTLLVDFVKKKDATRIDKFKKYIEAEFDINEKISKNVLNKNVNWLELCVYTNDIPLIGFLIKSGADINKINTDDGENIIFTCIRASNHIMLKYFIGLGVNPNLKNNDSTTPLLLSIILYGGFDCAKLLLTDTKVNFSESDKICSLIDLVMKRLDSKEDKYMEILDLLIGRKKKLNNNDMWWLRTCVYKNELDRIKLFLKYFPNSINKSSDDEEDLNTIVHLAIYENKQELLKYFFTFKELDYKKKNSEEGTYLEMICYFRMDELIDLYCKNYPKSLELTYNSHNIIDCVITTNNIIENNEDRIGVVKKIIKILISNGVDINYKNDIGYTLIFPAIQYGNTELVKFMIEMGAKIREPIIDNENEFPPFTNNDPIGFAIQLGNFDTMKVLVEANAILQKVNIKNIKFYTSILLSLRYCREDCFNYLIEIPVINKWLNSNIVIKNYLFDYAMKHICFNQNILKHFVPESKLKSIDFNDPVYNVSLNEKKISIAIDEYFELDNKLVVLYGLYNSIKIINKIKTIHKNNSSYLSILEYFKNLYENITNSINKYEEIKEIKDDFYEWINIFASIITDKIEYHISSNFKKIFELVSKLYWKIPDDNCVCCINSTDSDDFGCKKFNSKTYINKIKSLYKISEEKKNILLNFEDEIKQIINKYENGLGVEKFIVYDDKKFIRQDVVIKKLFKLYFPNKQPHYESLYHSIVFNTDKVITNEPNLIVISENKIKSTIFKSDYGNKPDIWINTYAPNIGKEEKTDLYHMFPFILDSILEYSNCVKLEADDINNSRETINKYYFYGMIEFQGMVETGCYEYFINSNGTLFHRMFKIWDKIPENVKKMINC